MKGFTLIELLVVIAIVAALTAIAWPQYNSYRADAYDLRANLDLRSVATAEEAYFIRNERYLSCSNNKCAALPGIARISKGVTLALQATTTGFTGTATHERGSGKSYQWDSSNGGLQ